uniref:Uncharacterized protein n=1 Tax=Neogobius melanostomus TaxID=47308 RepID=A0A8C6UKJ5_9GOBI
MKSFIYSCFVLLQRPDEEVVVDQGGTSSGHNIHYEKEELEGDRPILSPDLQTVDALREATHALLQCNGPKHGLY